MGDFKIRMVLILIVMFQKSTLPSASAASWGGLYPRESSSREVRSLNGMWNFRVAPLHQPDLGFDELWFTKPLKLTGTTIKMAVPSSYNDVTQDKSLRDHVGWAWYDRSFYVPRRWADDQQRVILRVGSAHYNSIVYVNGEEVATHEGGHLPIMADISNKVSYAGANLITICINNTLTPNTIPQGKVTYETDETRYPPGYVVQSYEFDFFNYDGLHRPIFIYTTPPTYIDDIYVVPQVDGTTGIINYEVTVKSTTDSTENATCTVEVFDADGLFVTSASDCEGQISIANAHLWWPYLMSDSPGYQYTLMIALFDALGNKDVYPQKVGIRQMGWNSTTVTINDTPLYLMGCGKHEDSDIRGKGLDYAIIAKDFNLLKWLGANSFRTSHYPYAEEIMDMADEEGIMVIDESPAVDLTGFGPELLSLHESIMEELIRRDKNRPSVIMWSVANEPRSSVDVAKDYFIQVVNWTKTLDPHRPVTCVMNLQLTQELAAYSLDAILLNRYYGWYSDTGHLEVIAMQVITEVTGWNIVYNKPVMISEYGAGAIAGTHFNPSFTFSEEYQTGLMAQDFQAFDQLKNLGFFFGEHIWNFADFVTAQVTDRPFGNHKGMFTRARQPKMAAHLLRTRYHSLANQTTLSRSAAPLSSSYHSIDQFFFN